MKGPIGGYFELELPAQNKVRYLDAKYFQSARACFYALLLKGRPTKVWLPFFNCDAMLGPLRAAGIEYDFYSIANDFSIADDVPLKDGEWLVYVNYFGLCTTKQQEILKKYNPAQIIFDHAQAYFSPPLDCLATIYSPRKFFGVPDGGLLITSLNIVEDGDDCGSFDRVTHLLKRASDTPESGYLDYQLAEKTLENFSLAKMSKLSRRILSSGDTDIAVVRRNENYEYLRSRLGHYNELDFDVSPLDGPLCYPFLSSRIYGGHEVLSKHRIYVPTYWPEVKRRCSSSSVEFYLSSMLLPLPCDQRYDSREMDYIVSILEEVLKNV